MPFYQQNQKVSYQYNAEGDINIGSIRSKDDLIGELQRLHIEVTKAISAEVIDKEVAITTKFHLESAIIETNEVSPDKKTIIEHLSKVRSLLGDISSVAGLVAAFGKTIEVVQKIF